MGRRRHAASSEPPGISACLTGNAARIDPVNVSPSHRQQSPREQPLVLLPPVQVNGKDAPDATKQHAQRAWASLPSQASNQRHHTGKSGGFHGLVRHNDRGLATPCPGQHGESTRGHGLQQPPTEGVSPSEPTPHFDSDAESSRGERRSASCSRPRQMREISRSEPMPRSSGSSRSSAEGSSSPHPRFSALGLDDTSPQDSIDTLGPHGPPRASKQAISAMFQMVRSRNRQTRSGKRSESPPESLASRSATESTLPWPEEEAERLWRGVMEIMPYLRDVRRVMKRMREKFRSLRRQMNAQDHAFMAAARPLLLDRASSLLLDRFEAMQSSRTAYYSSEAEYEDLDSEIRKEESHLLSLLSQILRLMTAEKAPSEHVGGSESSLEYDESVFPDAVPEALRGISWNGPPEYVHPLFEELISQRADLQNLKEEHEALMEQKRDYTFYREVQEKTGIGLADVSEFLDEFESTEQTMTGKYLRVKGRVERLARLCETKPAMRARLSAHTADLLNPELPTQDIELEDGEETVAEHMALAHGKFQELLSQPDYMLEEPEPLTAIKALRKAASLPSDYPGKSDRVTRAAKEFTIERLVGAWEGESDLDFVNRWLLHELRTSRLKIALLESIYLSRHAPRIRDLQRWQLNVLYYWFCDGTEKWRDWHEYSVFNVPTVVTERSTHRQPSVARTAPDTDLLLAKKQPLHTAMAAQEPASTHYGDTG